MARLLLVCLYVHVYAAVQFPSGVCHSIVGGSCCERRARATVSATSSSAPQCPETALQVECRMTGSWQQCGNIEGGSGTWMGSRSFIAAVKRDLCASRKYQRGTTGLSYSLHVCARTRDVCVAQMAGHIQMFVSTQKLPETVIQPLSSMGKNTAFLVTGLFSYMNCINGISTVNS